MNIPFAAGPGASSAYNPDEPAPMLTVEETITCPYCWQRIGVLLDLSVSEQEYVEDCSVCCRPILIRCQATRGELSAIEVTAESGGCG